MIICQIKSILWIQYTVLEQLILFSQLLMKKYLFGLHYSGERRVKLYAEMRPTYEAHHDPVLYLVTIWTNWKQISTYRGDDFQSMH